MPEKPGPIISSKGIEIFYKYLVGNDVFISFKNSAMIT